MWTEHSFPVIMRVRLRPVRWFKVRLPAKDNVKLSMHQNEM